MSPQEILWQPSKQFVASSNLKKFEHWLEMHKSLSFSSYDDLWQWSTDHIEDFWESLMEYFEIITHQPYRHVLSTHEMPGAKWFEGATLNYAEHIFRNMTEDRPAIIFQNENKCHKITWQDLEHQVLALQSCLKELGVGIGDRVVAYLPNIPETIACFLAVNSLGAVWSCCSPDFGVETVIERFVQIKPKVLIACDGYQYGGKKFSKLAEVKSIRTAISSIEQTILIPYLDSYAELSKSISWQRLIEMRTISMPLTFTAVPFDHPIWVLFSSGTTGKPKAITHAHGGVLLEHLKYLSFHNDAKVGEHFFWFSTTGWMMWNFLQASMLVGAIPVLYDGSPGFPTLDVLWELAERLPIHHFGTSAPYLTACMKKGLVIKDKFDTSQLRSIGSTGSPLPPDVFVWIYKNISDHVWLCSMSGGTDVCTAFVGGNPYLPVYKGAIQSRALGCAMYGYDENSIAVYNSLGEMVIEKPMPSMPIYFWNDPDGQRYVSSYFEKYPGKWRHGDWINIMDNGSLIIQGRSDATLNRKGVRIGTAEIYNVIDKLPMIKDSLILNIEIENGGDVMPLFVVMNGSMVLDQEVKKLVCDTLKTKCSPRHVPDLIYSVPDIPYTLSGKKMEVPIKKLFLKIDQTSPINRDAIKNPMAMDYFVGLSKKLDFT